MVQNFNKPAKADLPEDNDALFALYKKTGDIAVRNEIVNRYTYLAEIISRKFLNRGVEYDDIYQVACIALIKAVERFDPERVQICQFCYPDHRRRNQKIFSR